MNEKMADVIIMPIWAFLQILIKNGCNNERNNSSSPIAANPAIIMRFIISPPILSTFNIVSVTRVACSCNDFIISSIALIDSGSLRLAFHSANMLLRGIIAYTITKEIIKIYIDDLLNPKDFIGLAFTKNTYNKGGNTKVNSWLLI